MYVEQPMDLYRAASQQLPGWYQPAVKPTGYEINDVAHISRMKHLVNVFLWCPATIGFVMICNAVVYIMICLSFTTYESVSCIEFHYRGSKVCILKQACPCSGYLCDIFVSLRVDC